MTTTTSLGCNKKGILFSFNFSLKITIVIYYKWLLSKSRKDSFYKAFNTSLLVRQSVASLSPPPPSLAVPLLTAIPGREGREVDLEVTQGVDPLGHPCHDSLPDKQPVVRKNGNKRLQRKQNLRKRLQLLPLWRRSSWALGAALALLGFLLFCKGKNPVWYGSYCPALWQYRVWY